MKCINFVDEINVESVIRMRKTIKIFPTKIFKTFKFLKPTC